MGNIEPEVQAAVTLQHMPIQGWMVAFQSAFKRWIADYSHMTRSLKSIIVHIRYFTNSNRAMRMDG